MIEDFKKIKQQSYSERAEVFLKRFGSKKYFTEFTPTFTELEPMLFTFSKG